MGRNSHSPDGVNISGKNAQPGDVVIVSGTIGDHGITIMANQSGLAIGGDIKSDTMALHRLVEKIISESGDGIHVLRDPTRGGLATSLCEIALASSVAITLAEDNLPIRPTVAAACELIGLDPLYLANEGKCIVICAQESAEKTLACMRNQPEGQDAAIIGQVTESPAGRVSLTTRIGGTRLIEPLTGHPLPRIC
jgi:hydrogenase expression/formation protein HypE